VKIWSQCNSLLFGGHPVKALAADHAG